jgi:hypothetical protein
MTDFLHDETYYAYLFEQLKQKTIPQNTTGEETFGQVPPGFLVWNPPHSRARNSSNTMPQTGVQARNTRDGDSRSSPC